MTGPGEILDTDAVINRARISALQITVGVLGALILLVDGFNTQVIGYIAPQIAKNHASQPRRARLGFVGGQGWAADRLSLRGAAVRLFRP